MENKKNNSFLIIILMIAVFVVGLLVGYIVFELNDEKDNNVNENSNVVEENIKQDDELKNEVESEENIPYFDGLKSIKYHYENLDGTNITSKIVDQETMKLVLSIFKDKEITTQPDGLGGGATIYLILEYLNSEIKIQLLTTEIIEIDGQYYEIDYDGNYYDVIENVFN